MKTINNEHAAFLDGCASEQANIASLVRAQENGHIKDPIDMNNSLQELNITDFDALEPEELNNLIEISGQTGTSADFHLEIKQKLENFVFQVTLRLEF